MSTTASALHLLDDFIESIETVPSEIQQQLQLLREKDLQYEELQKNLFKKRSVLLKANEKSLDESMQVSLKKRAEKDEMKAAALLDEKIQIQLNLLQIVEQHLQRLEKDVYKPLNLPLDEFYPGEGILENIPEPQISAPSGANHFMTSSSFTGTTNNTLNNPNPNNNNPIQSSNSGSGLDSRSGSGSPRPPLLTISSEVTNGHVSVGTTTTPLQKVSPKKRMSLIDEPPTDPNEPVYCYCKQVSWGDMIACDNQNCSVEWFHYSCVGLTAPPKGKWYCNECKTKLNLSS